MLRGPSLYESGQNKINLDTVIYLTFVTKFSFSFQISYIYIYKETTYIELTQFITKSGHKKSRDVNQNDVQRKDLQRGMTVLVFYVQVYICQSN
jgi:hypothetical protein